MADFADRIKLYRTMNDLTLEDLAERLDTQKQAVHRWEQRQQIPKIDKVEEIAQKLNVSVPWLIGYDDGDPTLQGRKDVLCKLVDKMDNEKVDALITLAKTMVPDGKRPA